ncbi:MAG: GNAT family N-acetyltransferase [Pseudomonadota bacterium]|nr:GNAT family N-acetyltransferase [Pseudomonadota bacterium]
MPEKPVIRVMPAHDSLLPALLQLGVSPSQQAYVGKIDNLLADVARCPEAEPMAICLGSELVGYYRIDPHSRSVAGRDFDVPALGLRAFFIDARWQGRGLGTKALTALLGDVVERHGDARLLVLAVNVGNHAAVRLYQHAGFARNGELYHGGRAGPQHLMLRTLP